VLRGRKSGYAVEMTIPFEDGIERFQEKNQILD